MSIARHITRFPKFIADPSKTEGHFGIGIKGAGKSALGEKIAEIHYHHPRKYIILDGLDGNDFEAAFWAVPGPQGICYPTLLVVPPWMDVHGPNPEYSHIKPISSDEGLLKILKIAEDENRIITMGCKLWRRGTVGNVLKEWLFDLPDVAPRLKRPIFVLLREVGSYAFSQLKIFPELEDEFRRALIYLFREGRHHEIGFYFDAHRYVDLHRSIRVLCDHKHIKLSNKEMIPSELQWIFSHVKEWREKFPRKAWHVREQVYPRIQKLYPNELYSAGHFEELRPMYKFHMGLFRHKRPSDNFEAITGFRFVFNEEAYQKHQQEEAEGDSLQVQILRLKVEHADWSNRAIARELDCSHSTVNDYLRFANK